ncbi:MAG: D-mannonate dehydratase [Gemmatimonadaceae bacterium]|nr:D-mannonate dehydratase [Gemmatimonadaceae bacterium]
MMSHPMDHIKPGMKIAAQMSPEATQQDFDFVRQMGVEYAVCWTDGSKSSADYYASRREVFGENGIEIFGFGNSDVHNQDAIVLGLANQDDKIEEYKRHIVNLGKAGIPYTTYAHMGNGIWSTEREATRGGSSARGFDLDKATVGHWGGREYAMPLSHGREYSEKELWTHFERWAKQVKPVAEDAGVMIGIHPDDPPVPNLGGIPRCVFSSFDGYQKAMEIADSPNIGICFCVGCWLEGGDLMGRDTVSSIDHFGGDKIFKVHFRNVDQPLPHFVETFIDDGYQDMYLVMKALQRADFRGVLIPDHIPQMGDDGRIGTAYSIAYMKALVHRAEQEVALEASN